MDIFIGNLRIIDTRKDDKGNIYHFTLTRSLLLSIVCEIGIMETIYKDKYYLNCVSIHWNAEMNNKLKDKHFEFRLLDIDLIKNTAKDLLLNYFLERHQEQSKKMSEGKIITFCNGLVDEVFNTDQKEIDKKINLIY